MGWEELSVAMTNRSLKTIKAVSIWLTLEGDAMQSFVRFLIC